MDGPSVPPGTLPPTCLLTSPGMPSDSLSAMPYRTIVASDVALLTFPPNDAVFQRAAHDTLATRPSIGPDELERALRGVYARAIVRERDPLASFGGRAWYVYRDGRYSPFTAARWWEDPDAASIVVGADGRYLDASQAALGLLGVDLDGLRSQEPGAFTTPEVREILPWVRQLLIDTGELHSTSILRPADGRPDAPVEYRFERDGDGPGRHRATIRPIPLAAVAVAVEGSEPAGAPGSA